MRSCARVVYALALASMTSCWNASAVAQGWKMVVTSSNSRVIRYEWPSGSPVDHIVAQGMTTLAVARGTAIGPDGNLYVAGRDSNQVYRFDPLSGKPLGTIVNPGNGLSGPQDIIFREGSLYVASGGGAASGILRYDAATGAFLGEFGDISSAGVDLPTTMAFGPNGDLYVGGYASDNVVRLDGTTGAFLGVFADASSGLNGPQGMLFDANGNLLVSSSDSNAILRYRVSDGAPLAPFVPSGQDGLSLPRSLRSGPDGDVYVVCFGTNSVRRYQAGTGLLLGEPVAPVLVTLSQPDDLLFIPDACPADINQDGVVDGADLGLLLSAWGLCDQE